ncbi:hypothetical protein [Mucilaginibacter sp. L196]|uniref:hypothetical protein n=1 Tax=Mucilaginibacter sp. L196 TaxID=1641870 RepID=UPI00131EBEFC|nr:hypothetical protein [Mucilaginibacter sp. L196]
MKEQKWLLIGVGAAVLVGFLFRIVFEISFFRSFTSSMSIGFLFGVPFIMGFITVFFAEKKELENVTISIFTPWISIFGLLVITLLFNTEGWACWMMALPVFLVSASFGGYFAHKYREWTNNRNNGIQLSLIVLLPFMIVPLENLAGSSSTTYKAYTEIEIHASKEQIWGNVTRVRAIKQKQDSAYFTRFLGFPRPIQAVLDTEAVGGKRKAIFDKGLIFDEQVTAYEPFKLMTFTIHADPYTIPSTTMDKHIVIGGEYFDVLNGTYILEPEGSGLYKLRLYSNFKLHTTFNFYAHIWAVWIMRDIQQNILKVIKDRSESNT